MGINDSASVTILKSQKRAKVDAIRELSAQIDELRIDPDTAIPGTRSYIRVGVIRNKRAAVQKELDRLNKLLS